MKARRAQADRSGLAIRRVKPEDRDEWLRLRKELWPEGTPEEHATDMAWFAMSERGAAFVVARPEGGLGGFVEVYVRPFAEGCRSRPVGYLEAWYVDPDLRRQGLGAKLIHAAEEWAFAHGCGEMASDTLIDNVVGLRAHQALGFKETVRLVHLCKPLAPAKRRERK